MSAFLLALMLSFTSQLSAAEQAFDDASPAADDDAAVAAEPNLAESQESSIVIAAETPQPTLVEEPDLALQQPGQDAGAPANVPDLAEAPPTAAAAQVAEDSASAESSVLVGHPNAASLMRGFLAPPSTGQLAGVPVTLGAAVRDADSRADQTARAQAYWDLTAAVAQYYLAVQETAELALLRQGVAMPAAIWDVATADQAHRVEFTRQSAIAAQRRLHRLMGASAGASLPLPADSPHCGRYNTRIGEIFAAGQNPDAEQLDALLPLLHAELTARARLVADASDWAAYVSEHRDPANDGTGLLHAYGLLAGHRRALIESARDYNSQIAAYTELATPDAVGPDRLVAMLIRVSNPAEAPDNEASSVQTASATEEVARQDAGGPRRTFAWRPFDRLLSRERSIVTSRRILRIPGRNRN